MTTPRAIAINLAYIVGCGLLAYYLLDAFADAIVLSLPTR